MKTMGKLASLALATTLLAACGQSPKDKYIGAMEDAGDAKAGTFDMKFKDIAVSGGDSQTTTMINMVKSQLNDMKISGSYSMPDDSKYAVDVNVNAMGQEIPFNVIGDDKAMYLSTAFLSAVMDITQSLSGSSAAVDTSKLKELDGKYIDLQQFAKDSAETTGSSVTADVENLDMKQLLAYQKDLQKEFIKYLKDDVDDKRFEEKDGKLSFTMNKDDIAKLDDIQAKLAKDNPDYEQFKANIGDMLKELDKVNIQTVIDSKTKKQTYDVDIASAKNNIDAVKFTISTTPSDKVKEVTVPTSDQLATEEQLNEAMGAATGTDTTDTTGSTTITDEQFKTLLKQAKSSKASMSKAQRKQALEQYKPYLTDEQYTKLEKVLED